MHKFFFKTLSLVLIVVFVASYCDVAYMPTTRFAGNKSKKANCGCNADVCCCCCCKPVSSHNGSMCVATKPTHTQAEKQIPGTQSSEPAYFCCCGAKKASVISPLKNNLQNTTIADIEYFPVMTENKFESKKLKCIELNNLVYRPPRCFL
jgi:hypothetical protein